MLLYFFKHFPLSSFSHPHGCLRIDVFFFFFSFTFQYFYGGALVQHFSFCFSHVCLDSVHCGGVLDCMSLCPTIVCRTAISHNSYIQHCTYLLCIFISIDHFLLPCLVSEPLSTSVPFPLQIGTEQMNSWHGQPLTAEILGRGSKKAYIGEFHVWAACSEDVEMGLFIILKLYFGLTYQVSFQ